MSRRAMWQFRRLGSTAVALPAAAQASPPFRTRQVVGRDKRPQCSHVEHLPVRHLWLQSGLRQKERAMSRTTKAQPPKHGQIRLGGGMKREHAKRHLSLMVKHASAVAAYHGPNLVSSDAGQSSGGGFTGSGMSGGAAGADYVTTSTGNTDTESGGH
jgi:hypothetical protein